MVKIDGENLSVDDVWAVAVEKERVELADAARERMDESRRVLLRLIDEGEPVYGVTTGVGEFAGVRVDKGSAEEMQMRILRSHAVSNGEPLSPEIVRAAMLLRANSLAKGFSGVRVELVERLLEFLNEGIVPVVYNRGSIGASGDLTQLAQMSLPLIGEGEVFSNGGRLPAILVLRRKKMEPLSLSYKEGLALINGCQIMTGIGALVVMRSRNLLDSFLRISALTIEVLGGRQEPFDERIHKVRPFPGQLFVAKRMTELLSGSHLTGAKRSSRVQDAYSIRCLPQVVGAFFDVLEHVRKVIAVEMNSASDNPLIFPEKKEVLSGGNFHGEYVALALEYLTLALADLSSFAERHINRLFNPALSGLPAFLTPDGGLNSGLMLLQYSVADLVSENKMLSHPTVVDSIPVSADQEDHMSMGGASARKLMQVLENTETVVAAQLIAAAQGVEFVEKNSLSPAGISLYNKLRQMVKPLDEDRVLYRELENVTKALRDGKFRSV
ncbi:histidine ammonia-lyase [bacterium]|nr:histidine ammonia-lyase [bacterium]